MTWNDEIVEEVRRVRNENAEKFNFDISAICADIRKRQAESKRKLKNSIEQRNADKEISNVPQAA